MDEQEDSYTPEVDNYSDYSQLTQARVPLEEAGIAFTTRDDNGKIPIILIPAKLLRTQMELVITGFAILILGLIFGPLLNLPAITTLSLLLGPIVLVLGIYRSFILRIPEGCRALLTRGGRYIRTIEPGLHIVPPYIGVSHLVTQREIPFDVPLLGVPTNDNVRANIDVLLTFHIGDPYQFVFNISAMDFDRVLQAVCQDTMRAFVRTITSYQVMDMGDATINTIMEPLNKDMANYGVEIVKVKITFAQPPAEFMRSQEARQLDIIRQAEQQEAHALASRRQKDADALARQKVVAQIERDKDALQIAIQKAEAQRKLEELQAENEALRLARKEERIEKYPKAWEWEMRLAHLEVSRALAGNTRAMLQIGEASDITRAFLVRDVLQETPVIAPLKESSPAGVVAEADLGGEEAAQDAG
jgi:regulator of protease activity HflC (stomatin/prohibitin superfamily)